MGDFEDPYGFLSIIAASLKSTMVFLCDDAATINPARWECNDAVRLGLWSASYRRPARERPAGPGQPHTHTRLKGRILIGPPPPSRLQGRCACPTRTLPDPTCTADACALGCTVRAKLYTMLLAKAGKGKNTSKQEHEEEKGRLRTVLRNLGKSSAAMRTLRFSYFFLRSFCGSYLFLKIF